MRNLEALERLVDAGLRKQASYLGGLDTAENGAQVVTNAAPYFIPFVGSGFMLRDAYGDFKKGHIGSGLWNTAVGLGTGIVDGLSIFGDWFGLGEAGHAGAGAIRAAAAARKGVTAANAMQRLGKAYKVVKPISASRFYRIGMPATDLGVNTAFTVAQDREVPRSEWESMKPQERGNMIREWLNEGMAAREAEAKARQQQSQAAQNRVHQEAQPRYGWNYNTGTYERAHR